MSFDPGSIVTLIQTCQTLHDYYRDVKQSSVERRRLLDEVASLQSALEALQKLAKVGGPALGEQLAQLLGPSQPFYDALLKTLADVEALLRNGVLKPEAKRWKVLWGRLVSALWWTADKAEVKALLCDLERQKSRIVIALQHDIFQKQDVIDGKLDDVGHRISSQDRLKIAAFISSSDFAGHRITLLEERLSGTGIWMLQHPEFVAWRDNEESPRTLWCYGHPGAGKSVMAALIIQHLQSKSNIVLSVFCRYTSDNLKTPFPVLRGLLRQLIEKTTNVPSTICDLYWTKTIPDPDTLPDLLAGVAAIHAQPIYIVIDALDECKIALDLLHALQQLGPSFRILITSRPIFREIHEFPSIQIRASNDDILIAVDTTLSKLKHAWLDETLKGTIRAQIVNKADGMFLLASLQLRELERDVTCPRDVVAILDSLPRTLDEAYKLTFQRIREQGQRKNELACSVLAIAAWCDDPFSSDKSLTRHLLARGDVTQYTDIETVLSCCHGLVHMNVHMTRCELLDFVHYSMYEYTTARWSELFPENPKRFMVCLSLGVSALTAGVPLNVPFGNYPIGEQCWFSMLLPLTEPEELDEVISLLSTHAVVAALLQSDADLAPLVHDPLLIACCKRYASVIQYMIQTAPPNVQRFNEVIRVARRNHFGRRCSGCEAHCLVIKSINARQDMQVIVEMDTNGREEGSRCFLAESAKRRQLPIESSCQVTLGGVAETIERYDFTSIPDFEVVARSDGF